MSKKVSEMTEAERKRVRDMERKRRLAKKNGTALIKKAEPKNVSKKPVKLTDKIDLAKAKEVKAEIVPIRLHIVKPGDRVEFVGFTKEQLWDFATHLVVGLFE